MHTFSVDVATSTIEEEQRVIPEVLSIVMRYVVEPYPVLLLGLKEETVIHR